MSFHFLIGLKIKDSHWLLNFFFNCQYLDGWEEDEHISACRWKTTYLTARMKNDVSHREDEKRRISARGWRTTYLGARMKNDLSRRYFAVYWPCTGRKSAEIRRSSSLRWDTFVVLSAVDLLLQYWNFLDFFFFFFF